jgi:hypothetical protein
MLFSHKPDVILFIARDAMSLHPKAGSETLAISEELVRYLEVQDKKALAEAITGYANKNNLRGKRVLVMLHKDVIFPKIVSVNKTSDPKALIAEFEHVIPFEPADRQALGLVQKERLYLFGVNRQFYQLVVTALETAGAKVKAVVPGLAYGLSGPSGLTAVKINQIYDATSLTKAVNFLDSH